MYSGANVYREGRSGSIPSSRVSDVQILAFVLLEPSAGKLACSVPRGLGAGNRAWLPSRIVIRMEVVRIGDREANALVFVPVVPSYSDGVLVNDGDSCRA
jgi:hypothetical protein